MRKIWLISDTHFGHDAMYQFTAEDGQRVRREFSSASALEGDLWMLQRWREVVAPQDIVYHLGDVTMARGAEGKRLVASYLSTLPGHKRLILGNHDHLTMAEYKQAGFQKIMATRRFGHQAILSHIPLHPSAIPSGMLNIHGHTHRQPDLGPAYRNVSVERTRYAPILLSEVLGQEVKE